MQMKISFGFLNSLNKLFNSLIFKLIIKLVFRLKYINVIIKKDKYIA